MAAAKLREVSVGRWPDNRLFYFLSLLAGVLISVMVASNGGLTEQYGIYSATIIIHITGLLFIIAWILAKRERVIFGKYPWYLYTGGFIGVFTTVSNNIAFGRISVSAILALTLFGQSLSGLAVDHFGLFNMPKYPFTKRKIIGLALILIGIASMLNSFEIVAVLVSFLAGITILLSRVLNGKLAELTSVRSSTFFNYFFGLIGAVVAFFILGSNESGVVGFAFSPNWYIYFGGILGACVVLLSNLTVMKISAFYLTLLMFLGQVFSGVIVDIVISREVSYRNIIGGVFVALGMCVNLIFDSKRFEKQAGL